MGEPATKDVLSLDELEAVAGQRTGRKHILSILVENKPGVLTRIAGLFARRGFNIDTLAVGPTDDETISRITLTLDGAVHPIDQVTKQLHKLVNVLKIRDLEPEETLARELAMFKVSADGSSRAEVMQLCEIFRAKVVDVTKRSVVVEVTGTCDKIEAFERLGRPFGLMGIGLLWADPEGVDLSLRESAFIEVDDPELFIDQHHLRPLQWPAIWLQGEIHLRPLWPEHLSPPAVQEIVAAAVPSATGIR